MLEYSHDLFAGLSTDIMGENTCKGLSSQSYSKDTPHQTGLSTAILTSNSRKKIKIIIIIELENKSESQ